MPSSYSLRPADEAHRLQALRPYQLVTSAPDPLFDDLVRLTATLFDMPIAIVALVERDTVQFRLNVGLPANTAQESRDESLCSVAILNADTTVFENLVTNPCEMAEPGLVQRLNLQFYAGSPLRTEAGYSVGVLCVIDHKPRYFGPEEQQLLERLSALVMQLLNLKIQARSSAGIGASLWAHLYDQIEASVTRLTTLAELAKWEDHAHTDAAMSYRHSAQEEIGRVLDALHLEIAAQAL